MSGENWRRVGRDVLYVGTDGQTIRPAKIVHVEENAADGELVTLAVFTAGNLDRGLIEHHERRAFEGTGQEPSIVTRSRVPRDDEGGAHTWHPWDAKGAKEKDVAKEKREATTARDMDKLP